MYFQPTLRAKDYLHIPFTEALKSDEINPPKYLTGSMNSSQSKLGFSFFQRPAATPPIVNITSDPEM